MEGDGDLKAPHRVHLEAMARQGDVAAQFELDNVPPLPPLAAHVWGYFTDLARCRNYAGMGSPLPISYRDIEAWGRVTGNTLAPWELRAVLQLDAAFLTEPATEEAREA